MAWFDGAGHRDRLVAAGAVRLQCLEWGDVGEPLIFLHGVGDNPHIFDDLAPLLAEKYRVIAYARRGHGGSAAVGPYDTETFTADLHNLMNALGLERAHLIGWSMGGNEITAMAARHSERISSITYFDGAYDYSDPDYREALDAMPRVLLEIPAGAMSSLDRYREYHRTTEFVDLDDIGRIEAYLRETIDFQSDGSLRSRIPQERMDSLMAALTSGPSRAYSKVKCPALAVFASTGVNLHVSDPHRRAAAIAWETEHLAPFREKSVACIAQEIADVRVLRVPGTHTDFFLINRTVVVEALDAHIQGVSGS